MAATQQDHDKNNEKRATRRFALRLPSPSLRAEGTGARGANPRRERARICFYVDSAIQAARHRFHPDPAPKSRSPKASGCAARAVVRVEGGSPADKMAVAAVIEEYEFLADRQSRTEFLHIFPGIFLARLSSLPLCVFLAAIPSDMFAGRPRFCARLPRNLAFWQTVSRSRMRRHVCAMLAFGMLTLGAPDLRSQTKTGAKGTPSPTLLSLPI